MRLFFLPIIGLAACISTQAPAAPAIPLDSVAVIDQPILQGNLEPISKFVLESIGKRDSIHLVINSPGGSVFDGFAFLNRLDYARKRGVLVKCYVPELAASMAFQILLHCDHRYALKRASLLWHRVSVQVRGASLNAINTSDLLRELHAVDRIIIQDLQDHLNVPKELILFHLNKETMHTAPDLAALAPGFLEEVPNTVDGLYEALESEKVVRQSSPMDFLKRLFGGEIFYIKREFVIEAESNQAPQPALK
jgi:ATP-dependent protease ClpP protease subunit